MKWDSSSSRILNVLVLDKSDLILWTKSWIDHLKIRGQQVQHKKVTIRLPAVEFMHHTSQVQTWQGSSAGWKLSPGPYTLPSNTQSAQKQSYKIIKQLEKNGKNAADVLNSYQRTQGSTPRARWWSWRRETDSVLQSTWSPRPHTCRSCKGWSLRTSCCPRYAPLLRTYNLREENSVTGKNSFPLWLQFPAMCLPLQRGQQAPGSVTWCIQGSLGHSGGAHWTSPTCETQTD